MTRFFPPLFQHFYLPPVQLTIMSIDSERKGQVGVVTAVLLAGLVIAGITSALTWGLPLLQKNQDTRTLQDSLDSMKGLAEEIEKVANRGGSTEYDMNLGSGSLYLNSQNNSITYTVNSRAAYVSTREWVPLNERDTRGIQLTGKGDSYGVAGQDTEGVLLGKADQRGEDYRTRYVIYFREVDDLDTDTGYQVDLQDTEGSSTVSGGRRTIRISKETEETLSGQSKRGGNLVRKKVRINIE